MRIRPCSGTCESSGRADLSPIGYGILTNSATGMRLRRGTMRLVAIFILALASGSVVHAVEYHRDVAPILREYCVGCHNDDDYEGDFSVETFEALMKGGGSGPVIIPGKPDDSELIISVFF